MNDSEAKCIYAAVGGWIKRAWSRLLPVALVLLLYPFPATALDYCFEEAGREYGVSPAVLWSLSKVESNHEAYAVNVNRNGSYDY
jgi:hypothetical protein